LNICWLVEVEDMDFCWYLYHALGRRGCAQGVLLGSAFLFSVTGLVHGGSVLWRQEKLWIWFSGGDVIGLSGIKNGLEIAVPLFSG
jgi:hypothetical protein